MSIVDSGGLGRHTFEVMPLYLPFDDSPPPAMIVRLERQQSAHANAGGGAILYPVDFPGAGGTAPHQMPNLGHSEPPPWGPVDPDQDPPAIYE
jgi:hypothetical protein